MNYRAAFWFPIGLLAALAGLSLWLQYAVQAPNSGGPGSSKHIADYIVENFHATRTDITGKTENTLSARKTEHFLDDDTTQLEAPDFTAYDKQGGTVNIRSARGNVSSKGEVIIFTGKVVLVRDLHDAQGPLTLRTDYLKAIPKQHLMLTNRPVLIQGKNIEIHAGALQMNSQTRELLLTHHVKTHYEPIH